MYCAKTPKNDEKFETKQNPYNSNLKYINTVSTKLSNEQFYQSPKKKLKKKERCLKLTKKQKMLISLKGK